MTLVAKPVEGRTHIEFLAGGGIDECQVHRRTAAVTATGHYKKITTDERDRCRIWMNIFGITDLEDRDFLELSSGEQRMILLARAFVKNPSLLILDEPLHGLDRQRRSLVMEIIKAFCTNPQKTLIIVTHYPEELPSTIDHTLTLTRT